MKKILILNTDYPPFLTDLYKGRPGLTEASYEDQLTVRNHSLFGGADFYSQALRSLGYEAHDIHVNNLPLQQAWVRKYAPYLEVQWPAPLSLPEKLWIRVRDYIWRRTLRMPRWQRQVLEMQIRYFKPDLVWNQAMDAIPWQVMAELRPLIPHLIGQLAAPVPCGQNFKVYDLVISSLPNLVRFFEAQGVASLQSHLMFEPRVLEGLLPTKRDIPLLFVGSVTAHHRGRLALLEALCAEVDLQIWGLISDDIPADSIIRKCYRGPAWGLEMYQLLGRAVITLNNHIDMAEGYANNMRLFEATGCGTLLLTDAKENLSTLFEVGTEVVAYTSVEDCVAKAKYYLEHREEATLIGAAGQQRTLRDHTYHKRLANLMPELEKRVHVHA